MNKRGNHLEHAADPAAVGDTAKSRVEQISTTKRTLIKAGWIAPVVAAISLPASSYVRNGSGFDPNKD
jgi:hypothetical protein